jgi:hypothetical protein
MNFSREDLIAKRPLPRKLKLLAERLQSMGIKPIYRIGKIEQDPQYSFRDPEEDFEKINKALNTIEQEGTMDESPPPIVAVSVIPGRAPLFYYVRNDISEWRKKKTVKAKPKRKITKKKECGCK